MVEIVGGAGRDPRPDFVTAVFQEGVESLEDLESGMVLDLIRKVRDNGLPVILISHNMPDVFAVADRIHIQRLGRRATVVTPETHSMNDAVAIMTGAADV